MIITYAGALAILLVLATIFAWAFLPSRYLPGNRARHLRIRLHLRLHPGKGFAHLFSLWLRWGRLATLRRAARIRPALPLRYRILSSPEHSVFLGRAHPLPARATGAAGRAPARDGATAHLQDGFPGRRDPALPRPGHRHHHQARHLCPDQRGPRSSIWHWAWTTTRSAGTAPGTGTSRCRCSRTRSWPSPPAPPARNQACRNRSRPAVTPAAARLKRGPDTCGQLFAPPRTYSPAPVITDETGRELIPLTAAEARRLFNLRTRVIRPDAFHEYWSNWRRYRQAAARKSHYARRNRNHGALL